MQTAEPQFREDIALEPISDLTFEKLDIEAMVSLDEWIEGAKREFPYKQLAASILQLSDVQLAERVRDDDPNAWLDIIEGFAKLRDHYQAGAKVCETCCARLFVVLEREFGTDRPYSS